MKNKNTGRTTKKRGLVIALVCALAAVFLIVLILAGQNMLQGDRAVCTASAGILPANPTEFQPGGAAAAVTTEKKRGENTGKATGNMTEMTEEQKETQKNTMETASETTGAQLPDPSERPGEAAEPSEIPSQGSQEKTEPTTDYSKYSNKKYAWWFIRKKDHTPSGSGEEITINDYGGYYLNKKVEEGDKVIYLTFDCGYELGYTDSILDTLEKHEAKATFFVTKPFIKSSPELVVRMKEEGHMVGNHTVTHPSMPDKGIDALKKEINGCADYMYEQIGYKMDPYLRPPMGEYSERTLKLAEDLGYKSIFWSIAYKDYDPDNQPGKQYVIDHYNTYHHNGAIPLIHNISESDTEALDEVLTLLEKEGYRFGTLDELP